MKSSLPGKLFLRKLPIGVRYTGIQSSIGEFWAPHRSFYWKTHPDQMLHISQMVLVKKSNG